MPNANFIPPARVGSCVGLIGTCFGEIVTRVELSGTGVGSMRLFGYQHVGIDNANPSRWGSYPIPNSKANGFAF